MRRDGQLSKKNYQDYLAECDKIIDKNIKLLPKEEQRMIFKKKGNRFFKKRLPKTFKLFPSTSSDTDLTEEYMINFDLNTFEYTERL